MLSCKKKPYGASIFSFLIQKFSLCLSLSLKILVDDEVLFCQLLYYCEFSVRIEIMVTPWA